LAPDRNTASPSREGNGGDRPAVDRMRERARPLLRWESGLLVSVLAILLFGIETSSAFLTSGNLFDLSLNIGEVAIMTLPLTLIIITGEIDLSIASTLGLSSAMVGYLASHGWSMGPIFITVLAIGAAAGAFNGLLVTRLGLPSLAVTIGTLTLYRGIAVVILGPLTVSAFPTRYTNIGINTFPHSFLSYSMVFFLVLAVVYGLVLHFTPFGRSLFVIGANQEAAIYAGIRVKRIKTLLFIVSGVVCAFAGMLYTFKLSTAVQDNGLGLELTVVAIVLLGGVSIFGGKGSILGLVLAVFTYAGLQNALFLTSFPQRALGIVTGGLLIVSVLVPNIGSFVRRARDTLKRRQVRGRAAIESG
jgi:rhamnose transport system permease protein